MIVLAVLAFWHRVWALLGLSLQLQAEARRGNACSMVAIPIMCLYWPEPTWDFECRNMTKRVQSEVINNKFASPPTNGTVTGLLD